jgi:hypothetical protein
MWNTNTASIAGKKGNLKSLKHAQETMRKKYEARIRIYNLNPILCRYCKKPIPYFRKRAKFCNVSCSNSHRKKELVEKRCLFCNKIITNNKYCSNICCNEHHKKIRFEKNKKLILQGKQKNQKRLKSYLIFLYGEKCMKCCWNEINVYTKKVPIELHHKD